MVSWQVEPALTYYDVDVVSVEAADSVGTVGSTAGAAVDAAVTEAVGAEVEPGRRGTPPWGRSGGSWEGSMVGRRGKGARPGKLRGGNAAREGTALPVDPKAPPPASDMALRSGSGRLRLGKLGSGGKPPGRGSRPGSVDPGWKPVGAGFCGVSGLRAWLVDGSRGTVGKPVCSSLGMMGGAELIDRLDNESSRPAGTAGPVAEGLTAESWTSVNPSFSGLTGSLGEFPGKLIFFPSSKGLVGILCRYP